MANVKRLVPYKNFKFLVKWDGKAVAGINKVGAMTRTSEVISWRAGGDPSAPYKSPGQSDYGPITLEQGVTDDAEFEKWANKVWDHQSKGPKEMSLADYQKDITITLLDEAGATAVSWNIFKCWVSEFTALPELDASANSIAIRSMTLQNEGWVRDAGSGGA